MSQAPEKLLAGLEALLFAYGEALTAKSAAKLLGSTTEEAERGLKDFKKMLDADAARGLTLLTVGDEYQLATKPEFGALIETLVKSEVQESLTPAAQETLAIVAYAGPVGRAEIDYVRGVNSGFILRSLSLRGLVSRSEDPHRANAYRYTISADCMKHLGVTDLADLPEYAKYRALAEKFHAPATPAPNA